MPLPISDITWPPVSMMAVYSKMAEWAAWYSGEPSRIMAVYQMNNATAQINPWWRFWTRAKAGDIGAQRAQLHVPLAGDLAAHSASLLFGEPARIRIRSARTDDDDFTMPGDDIESMDKAIEGQMCKDPMCQNPGHPAENISPDLISKRKAAGKAPRSPESDAEARLLEIIEGGDLDSRLVEAAEGAAALGGIYIYPVWDENLRPFPLMGIAQSDMAVPEFQHGILTAVTFHRSVQADGNRILRHLERHEMEGTGENRHCVIYNGIFQGTEDRLGIQMGLGVGDSLMGVELQPKIDTPFKDLDVEYVPNIRPNRLWRASGFGVSDFQGSEGLMDALDEVYASWMRDVRLAKARILVPREYLRNDPNNKNAPSFDVDQEIYVGMDMEPGLAQDARAMLAHQFAIRYKEHQETAHDLIDRIVSNAGYTPTTLGTYADKGTGTGTALRISEHKTLLTLRRKSGWWRTAVANTLYRMMIIDKEIFGSKIEPVRPTVVLANSIIDNPLELAQTALALKTAEAASIETRVRIVNPDWSEDEVDAEVKRIQDEQQATKPAPPVIGAGPQGAPQPPSDGKFGNPQDDMASMGKKPMTDQHQGPAPANEPPASPPQAKQAK